MADEPAAWKVVAAKLAQLGLPFLGGLLGGNIPIVGPLLTMFGGGEAAGRGAAKLIALALGVDATPEAISNAIDKGDTAEVVARLRAVESEAQSRWTGVTAVAVSDNTAGTDAQRLNAQTSARLAEMAIDDPIKTSYKIIVLWGAGFSLTVTLILLTWAMFSDVVLGTDILKRIEGGEVMIGIKIGLETLVLGWHWTTRDSLRKAAITAPAQAAAQAAANAVSNK